MWNPSTTTLKVIVRISEMSQRQRYISGFACCMFATAASLPDRFCTITWQKGQRQWAIAPNYLLRLPSGGRCPLNLPPSTQLRLRLSISRPPPIIITRRESIMQRGGPAASRVFCSGSPRVARFRDVEGEFASFGPRLVTKN